MKLRVCGAGSAASTPQLALGVAEVPGNRRTLVTRLRHHVRSELQARSRAEQHRTAPRVATRLWSPGPAARLVIGRP
jgi:hypothetical protein